MTQQMNQLLKNAFERAAELPQAEQNRFARFLLAELASERQWTELFARPESEDVLEWNVWLTRPCRSIVPGEHGLLL